MLSTKMIESARKAMMFPLGSIYSMPESPVKLLILVLHAAFAKYKRFVFSVLDGSGDGHVEVKTFLPMDSLSHQMQWSLRSPAIHLYKLKNSFVLGFV